MLQATGRQGLQEDRATEHRAILASPPVTAPRAAAVPRAVLVVLVVRLMALRVAPRRAHRRAGRGHLHLLATGSPR